MQIIWYSVAWNDYLYWQQEDKKLLKRINTLIKDVMRSPFEGIGKPEPLRNDLSGFWSRRIDDRHRLVYRVREGKLSSDKRVNPQNDSF